MQDSKPVPVPKAVVVNYSGNTLDGEQYKGVIYTISTEQMRDALERILDKFENQELETICLQVQ